MRGQPRNEYNQILSKAFGRNGDWLRVFEVPVPISSERQSFVPDALKLDLTGPRLNRLVAIYASSDPNLPARFGSVSQLTKGQAAQPTFFALDRPGKGTAPIFAGPMGTLQSYKMGERNAEALFHALPADFRQPPLTTTPLFEFVHKGSGQHAYSTNSGWTSPGFERSEKPIALVWRNPMYLILPAE